MALFPRKIDGKYAIIGRQDGENLFYLTSDDLLHWDEGEKLITPVYPWELVQMGNCGSPIEIDEGWLLLTHGVGAMRKYSIGAVLSGQGRPAQGAKTNRSIRSCHLQTTTGRAMFQTWSTPAGPSPTAGRLFIPYAVADSSVTFCWVDLDELLERDGVTPLSSPAKRGSGPLLRWRGKPHSPAILESSLPARPLRHGAEAPHHLPHKQGRS